MLLFVMINSHCLFDKGITYSLISLRIFKLVRKRKQLDLKQVEAMLEEGLSLTNIGLKLKCHTSTVGNFLYAIDPKYRQIVRNNARNNRKDINFTNPKNDGGGYKSQRQYEDGT